MPADAHTVTVTGTGTRKVAPDSAVVRLAAVGRGAGVAEAYDAMTAAASGLVEVASRHTERRRIASTGISVWPWHDRDESCGGRGHGVVRLGDAGAARHRGDPHDGAVGRHRGGAGPGDGDGAHGHTVVGARAVRR